MLPRLIRTHLPRKGSRLQFPNCRSYYFKCSQKGQWTWNFVYDISNFHEQRGKIGKQCNSLKNQTWRTAQKYPNDIVATEVSPVANTRTNMAQQADYWSHFLKWWDAKPASTRYSFLFGHERSRKVNRTNRFAINPMCSAARFCLTFYIIIPFLFSFAGHWICPFQENLIWIAMIHRICLALTGRLSCLDKACLNPRSRESYAMLSYSTKGHEAVAAWVWQELWKIWYEKKYLKFMFGKHAKNHTKLSWRIILKSQSQLNIFLNSFRFATKTAPVGVVNVLPWWQVLPFSRDAGDSVAV